MSKRLQVLFDEAEWKEIRRTARSQRMTLAEWVRQALRTARQERSSKETAVKIAAIRSAMRHAHPTADIDQMNAEIERGYLDSAQS
ncbi:MAG TPA: hypothetical protein VGG73_23460 [Vicinamibacterales bacterium]|jgi:hypothetical protein